MELKLKPRKKATPKPRKNSAPLEREKLQWPAGRPRSAERVASRFGKEIDGKRRPLSYKEAVERLKRQLAQMGVTTVTLSSNYDGAYEPTDTGVACYFDLEGQQTCLPCDRFDRVADNIDAIAHHIQAMRAIERWGVGTVKQAFAGFAALPPAQKDKEWWHVLGLVPTASKAEIELAFKTLAMKAHPDRGGSNDDMARLSAARTQALKAGT